MTLVKKHRFEDYILGRIKKNKNFLGMFTGSTGSGKSYSALTLAESLDKEFNIDRIAFSPKEFMDILNNGNLKKGSVVVWDEIGIGMNSRNWQSVSNKMINFLMQSFRHLNLIVLFTCPDITFLDIGTRKLLHCLFETETINVKTKKVKVKPKVLQVNQSSGKVYMKYLRIITPEGVMPFTRINFSMPSKKLIDNYEIKKTAFTSELNQKIYNELSKIEEKEDPKPIKELTQAQSDVLTLLDKGLTIPQASSELGITSQSFYEHLKLIKKKGYTIKAIREDNKVIRYDIGGFS